MGKKAKRAFPLLARGDELVEALRRLAPVAVKHHHASATHDARVVTRRMKAMLDLYEPLVSKRQRKPLAKILKKLRRELGPLRDLDVMLEHLESVPATYRPAGDWLIARMKWQRTQCRRYAQRRLDPPGVLAKLGAWWGVREELAEHEAAIHERMVQSLHLQLDGFAHQADALCIHGKGCDPHAVRIAGKKLRYTVEAAVQHGYRLPAAVARSFKQMQDALGAWHDQVMLAEAIARMTVEEHLALHDAKLQSQLLELAGRCIGRALRQLGRFVQLWNSRGEELAATIRAVVPMTEPGLREERGIRISQMDHDRPGLEEPPGSGHVSQESLSTV